MRLLIVLFMVGFNSMTFAQVIRIGLLTSVKSTSATVKSGGGFFRVLADTVDLGRLSINELMTVKCNSGGTLLISGHKGDLDGIQKLRVLSDSLDAYFILASQTPSSKTHKYKGSLELINSNGRLRMVNVVEMNHYLAGVVETEGGGGKPKEYYKVQAVMSRTFAVENIKRHEKDGYSLCDDVHCQAYYNMQRFTPQIETAVWETSGELLVTADFVPVNAFFHANCGGQTSDASYVWNTPVSYCEPFIDTFCVQTKQAKWEKLISKKEWTDFLIREYAYPINDPILGPQAYSFVQPQRMAFFVHPALGIPLRDLRTKFNLKSSFFDVSLQGDQVKLSGRGFGHGVGLCQEGAMEMARKGYDYEQIARFYFKNVQLINYTDWQYFNQGFAGMENH